MFEATIWTNILLGVVQGLTEFLPISSSGHLILLREIIGSVGEFDLAFDALLHFSTALAIVVYFWRDVRDLSKAFIRLVTPRLGAVLTADEETVLALIAGTVPAVMLGLLLEDIMATLFRNPLLVAGALVFGSIVMFVAERYKNHALNLGKFTRSWRRGLLVGLFQSLALIPGTSRSGMTISAGMLLGMDRREAARFGFLLGVPLLLGAGMKKALELGFGQLSSEMLAGTVAAFVVALLVIHFLLKFLRNNTLHIFIAYRLLLAVGIILVFI